VIVHDRDAHHDSMEIVREFPQVKGVFHCYAGSVEDAKMLVRMGWMLSFNGVITFKNARKALEVIRQTPMEHLMIETDSPYLAPVPFRGKRNDSRNVHLVAEKMAELKEISVEEVERITTENGKKFFHIP
jgi:TatD DNase family protein